MKQRTITALFTLSLLLTALAVPAGATLLNIGTATYGSNSYNLIYDDNPAGSVVWLDYSNSPSTWTNQVAWANSLNSIGTLTYNFLPGYSMSWGSDWQLPTTVDNQEWNVLPSPSSSQMAYLYYTQLGNTVYEGLTNAGPFANLQNNAYYWSSTEYSALPDWNSAWYFNTTYGFQGIYYKDDDGYLLGFADRFGQLETAPVPEPSTLLLLGGGLAGLVGLRYRRRGC